MKSMTAVDSTALPEQASGRANDCEKAEVREASTSGSSGTSEVDNKT